MPSEAAEPGVFVDVRESDAPDARVVERRRLYGSSHALVIGIDNYTAGWPKLKNAVKDARIVADELKRHGFSISLQTDLNESELRTILREFYAIKGEDPEARLLLWYAGHGHTIQGEGFLVPADAPLPNDEGFKVTALHMRDFGGLMRLAESKHVLSVFDSCFSGTIFDSRTGASLANVTEKTAKPVRQFVTAGDSGQAVRDDGSFRELFVRAIRGDERADANGDGFVTGDELGLFLSQRMTNLTNAAQTPRYGKLQDVRFDQGDFVFVLPEQIEPPLSTRSDPNEAALDMAFWTEVKDSDDPALYQAYLESFPNGRFAPLARLRVGSVLGPEPREQKDQQQAAMTPVDDQTPEFEIEEMEAPYRVTTRANVRVGPATRFEKIDTLASGQLVKVTGKVKGENWYQIAFGNDREGFIFGKLIQDETSYKAKQEATKPSTQLATSTPSQTQMAVGVYDPEPGSVIRDCPDCPEMVVIPDGRFTMGSPSREQGRQVHEGPQHAVSVGAFALGKYEVTRKEFARFASETGYRSSNGCFVNSIGRTKERSDRGWHNPGYPQTNRDPVACVDWNGAQAFARWLSQKTGKNYRLPTEAEWAYAARAGTTTSRFWGNQQSAACSYANGADMSLRSVHPGWTVAQCNDRQQYTAPVGTFAPNAFGLYDMLGNVWEWVEDCWHGNYRGAPLDGTAWTRGSDCRYRVTRGGSWFGPPEVIRSAVRFKGLTIMRMDFVGFRVARSVGIP